MSTQGHILIVDDEKEIVSCLQEILDAEGFQTSIAYNGQEALGIIKDDFKTIDCVISDINMPKMNGVTFIKEVRALDIHTPFIFFTGFGNESYIDEAVKYGAFDFIDKPNFNDVITQVKLGVKYNFELKKAQDTDMMSEYQKLANLLKSS